MPNATTPAEGDTITLPKGFFQHLKYSTITMLGIAWMGGTFAFFTFGFFVAIMFMSETKTLDEGAWSTSFNAALIGMTLSAIIITIITSVKQARKDIEAGFTAWIKEASDLSISQHGVLFMIFLALGNLLD